jgi:hypothetical protein
MANLKREVDKTKLDQERMKQQLSELIDSNRVSVEDDLKFSLASIVQEKTGQIWASHVHLASN